MNSKSSFLWLAAVAGMVLLASGCDNKDAVLAAQREKELAAIHAELDQAKTESANLQTELARSRKDNEELLRLRNEVRQLREDKVQLTRDLRIAQAARGAVQQQVQQLQQVQTENQQLRTTAQEAQSKEQEAANACIANLRQIEAAKLGWTQLNKPAPGTIPTAQDLSPFWKDGQLPTCPAGGAYSINAIETKPTCTIPGHALPP